MISVVLPTAPPPSLSFRFFFWFHSVRRTCVNYVRSKKNYDVESLPVNQRDATAQFARKALRGSAGLPVGVQVSCQQLVQCDLVCLSFVILLWLLAFDPGGCRSQSIRDGCLRARSPGRKGASLARVCIA